MRAPIQATLAKRAQSSQTAKAPTPATPAEPTKPSKSTPKATRGRVLTSKNGKWATTAQVPEQAKPEKPVSGSELAQRALAMARGIGREELDGGKDSYSTLQEGKGNTADNLNLEWYFDSFIKKLNGSARFVKYEPYVKGRKKALVEIFINQDGTLKEYRVLRSADQQGEIAYIKAVVDRAVPFAAFPPALRKNNNSLSMRICILPPDNDGGAGFSRTSSGDC
ncbi:MAG TPA: hypothetical protein VL381_04840 [Rhodocyclaceae bacterium]|nr:hypothetical protein [Rhodocyclaceae bacterium]